MSQGERTISLRMPEKTHEAVIETARRLGISKSTFIRKAVEEKLAVENPHGNVVVIRLRIPRRRWMEMEQLKLLGEIDDISAYMLHLLWNDCEKRVEMVRRESEEAKPQGG